MSTLICRLLGIPSKAEIRAMILREIDADRVWREGSVVDRIEAGSSRWRLSRKRDAAVSLGEREDTRD